jgi:uncharacterized protein DUF3822
MDNLIYQYLDPDFNPENTGEYTLLVKVDGDQLTFAITDKHKLLLLSGKIDLNLVSEPATENDLFSKEYSRCVVGLPFTGFTLVPASLFNPENVADFARFLDVKPTDRVFSQPLDADNQVVFKTDENQVSIIAGKFGARDMIFAPKGWITAVAATEPFHQNLYLNVNAAQVEILNFRDNKLRFYNRFAFESPDELAYYASLVVHELKLQPNDGTLILSGDVNADDDHFKRLADFFGKVEIDTLQPIGLPKEIAAHSILSLTALSLCGSLAVH